MRVSHLLMVWILYQMMFITVKLVASMNNAGVDVKKYSYICLAAKQELCLGISPGESEPKYNPNKVYGIQVKPRTNNEYTGNDYKKTRWDVDYGNFTISLSRFKDLCLTKKAGFNELILSPCSRVDDAHFDEDYGLWDLKFQNNVNWESTLELLSFPRRLCLTIVTCDPLPSEDYCNPASETVPTNTANFNRGAYVKLKPCWDDPASGGLVVWKQAQVWRQKLDCAIGCPPFLLLNGKCDAFCNVPECQYDNGDCGTTSPTPPTTGPTPYPTYSPTKFPTSNPLRGPTNEPTTRTTTLSPTTTYPSTSPTNVPTRKATKMPTEHPTFPCPPNTLFDFCGKFTKSGCSSTPGIKKICIYCFDKCLPKADERACQVDGFYDHCKATCPTYDQLLTCPTLSTSTKCENTSFGKQNCVWCGTKCLPGLNRNICVSSSFYSHCTTVKVPCPTEEQFQICDSFKTNEKGCKSKAGQKQCIWCPTSKKCMPSKREEVCTEEGFYSHCTSSAPTNSPTSLIDP